LSKQDVRRAGLAMVSGMYSRGRLHVVHTGGTTGTPLPVYCTRTVLQRNYAFFARFREWVGVPDGSRVATFAGRTIVPPDQRQPPYWRYNRAAKTLLCSSYHIAPETVAAYAEALRRFEPALIDSYPSSIEPIARFAHEHGLKPARPQAVITSSETLDPPVRRLVERTFGCPVFDHYGAAEMAAFITQCRAGVYHVNPEFGIVEILRDGKPVRPGEAGEIVATGFINPVMPLIRYATGDLAVLGSHGCSCGRAFPVVERIVGRMDDVLVTPEGRRIGRLDPIFKSVTTLVETRIVQDAVDHVRVETVTEGELPAIEQATLVGELRHRLGPSVRIDVVRVPRIARTSSGKFRAVVNLLEPPQHEPADPEIGTGRS
jgi:phenylacetate-CoA ligase